MGERERVGESIEYIHTFKETSPLINRLLGFFYKENTRNGEVRIKGRED